MSRVLTCLTATSAVALALLTPGLAGAANLDVHAGQPKAGSCYAMSATTFAQPNNDAAKVPCSSKHTAVNVGDAQLPSNAQWTDTNIQATAQRACTSSIRSGLGGTNASRHMTTLYPGLFVPTADQRSQGARWVECVIANLSTSADRQSAKLVPMPSGRSGFLNHPLTNVDRRCNAADYYRVTCAEKHAYRTKGVTVLPKGPYPTRTAFIRDAKRRCPGIAGRSYLADWPVKAAWKAGDRTMVCSTKTTR